MKSVSPPRCLAPPLREHCELGFIHDWIVARGWWQTSGIRGPDSLFCYLGRFGLRITFSRVDLIFR